MFARKYNLITNSVTSSIIKNQEDPDKEAVD
jgi:hypothetical protein